MVVTMTKDSPKATSNSRETLVQVEPRLGQVLLGMKDISAYARGGSANHFEVVSFSPEDAIQLAQQLASAAELIMNMTKEMQSASANIGVQEAGVPKSSQVDGQG